MTEERGLQAFPGWERGEVTVRCKRKILLDKNGGERQEESHNGWGEKKTR